MSNPVQAILLCNDCLKRPPRYSVIDYGIRRFLFLCGTCLKLAKANGRNLGSEACLPQQERP